MGKIRRSSANHSPCSPVGRGATPSSPRPPAGRPPRSFARQRRNYWKNDERERKGTEGVFLSEKKDPFDPQRNLFCKKTVVFGRKRRLQNPPLSVKRVKIVFRERRGDSRIARKKRNEKAHARSKAKSRFIVQRKRGADTARGGMASRNRR